MQNRILKVAQIGCGAFAASQDMPNFAAHPQVECVWCCDVNRDSAERLASQFGVPRFTDDFNEIMADPEVDFVKIATSHEAHLGIIEAAAQAGKHVFCEKPMAMERLEALHIIRAVRQSGIRLCVDFNRRMSPALQALHRRWEAHIANPQTHPWRYRNEERPLYPEEKESHLLMRIQDDSLSYRMQHLDPLRGGGEIIGESVHWLDLACWWFAPQRPVEIQAFGSTRFSHSISLRFSGGDTATVLFNCGGTFDYPKELFEVTAQGGLFRSECFVENQYFGIPGPERETFALQRDCMADIGQQGGLSGYMEKYAARVRGLQNSKEGYGDLWMDKGHEGMLDGFVQAILNDTPSPCDEMSGYLATYLARLAIQSIETRQSIPVLRERVDFTVL